MKRGSAAFLTAASLLAAMLWGLGFVMTSPVSAAPSDGGQQPADDGKLRIICFGAHPDDCELQISGTAALWTAQGHHVKFVSVTNGDIGHWREAGGPLAQRRKDEVMRGRAKLHVVSEVLDIHDGELLPTLENRRTITRLIREWNADLVFSHRPNDYHPDHRYTGVLVQDAAYMVTVPFFCPDVPYLKKNPVFMYYPDRFQKPNPSKPDVAVSIDSVIEQKRDALMEIESQFYEGGANGSAELMPADPEKQAARRKDVRERVVCATAPWPIGSAISSSSGTAKTPPPASSMPKPSSFASTGVSPARTSCESCFRSCRRNRVVPCPVQELGIAIQAARGWLAAERSDAPVKRGFAEPHPWG